MGRIVLLTGAGAWSIGAVAALLLAMLGLDWLLGILPPLAIDRDAVRGAIFAVAAGLALGAVVHVAVLLGLRAGRRRFSSAAILLTSLCGAVFVALAAAAFASAAAEPASAWILIVAGVAASVAAIGYAFGTVRLIADHRSRTAS